MKSFHLFHFFNNIIMYSQSHRKHSVSFSSSQIFIIQNTIYRMVEFKELSYIYSYYYFFYFKKVMLINFKRSLTFHSIKDTTTTKATAQRLINLIIIVLTFLYFENIHLVDVIYLYILVILFLYHFGVIMVSTDCLFGLFGMFWIFQSK